MATTERVTVTLPVDLVEESTEAVHAAREDHR
jgi:hypothetical protein